MSCPGSHSKATREQDSKVSLLMTSAEPKQHMSFLRDV